MIDKTLLTDAWNVHVPEGPNVIDRKQGILRLATHREEASMEGHIFEDHHVPTGMVAGLAERGVNPLTKTMVRENLREPFGGP